MIVSIKKLVGLSLLIGLASASDWKRVATKRDSGILCPPTPGYYSAPKPSISSCKKWCEDLSTCNAISWNGSTCWVQTCPNPAKPSFAAGVTGYEGWVRQPSSPVKSASFSVVLFSDPQFGFYDDWDPFTTKMNYKLETIFQRENIPLKPSVFQRTERLKRASIEMIQEAQRLVATSNKDFKAYMVNGDLVNDDRENEVIPEFEKVFQTYHPEALGLPLFLGLGNHDFYNDDTAGHTLRFYSKYLRKLKSRIRDLDVVSSKKGSGLEIHRGSWSYAVDLDKYTFLFLQNSADDSYNGEWVVKNWIDHNSENWFERMNIALTSPKSWLIHQICKAEERGQSIILLPHSATAFSKVVEKDKELEQIIEESAVLAVFSGHIHNKAGEDARKIAGKPCIYLGSPQFETYTTVDFKMDGSSFAHHHYSFDPKFKPKVSGNSTLVEKGNVSFGKRRAAVPGRCSAYRNYATKATVCSVDRDCPRDTPVCDNNALFGSGVCTTKKKLLEQCTYDSTCASNNCHTLALQCQCTPCNTPGCGDCEGNQVCQYNFFEPNKCITKAKKAKSGENCYYDKDCVDGAICLGNGGGTMQGYCRLKGAPNGYLCGGPGNGHNENELCASGKCCCSQDAGYNGCGSTWMCYGADYWDDECRGNGSSNGHQKWWEG